jgi:hypothetical protein
MQFLLNNLLELNESYRKSALEFIVNVFKKDKVRYTAVWITIHIFKSYLQWQLHVSHIISVCFFSLNTNPSWNFILHLAIPGLQVAKSGKYARKTVDNSFTKWSNLLGMRYWPKIFCRWSPGNLRSSLLLTCSRKTKYVVVRHSCSWRPGIARWRMKFHDGFENILISLQQSLSDAHEDFYPNIRCLFMLLLTLPVTGVWCERSL